MSQTDKIKWVLERFVGKPSRAECCGFDFVTIKADNLDIGYSQFNELLLLLGFDRITKSCFQFLVDQKTDYKESAKICSIQQLERGVDEFRKIAILFFANVRRGFNMLAKSEEDLLYYLETLSPISLDVYAQRHKPILPIDPIDPDDTYLMGYLVQNEIAQMLKTNPNDETARSMEKRRAEIIKRGIRNQLAYLASDHMDVYVATSMRLKHEYYAVNKTISRISNHEHLKDLNLRWFDPTQAYCEDRIDKGLAEGLMLKRAKCTIYLAQESDTLGKDSELASTLAQGKPVIAIVPSGDKEYVDELLALLKELNPNEQINNLIIDQLKVFDPGLAWANNEKSQQLRFWINHTDQANKTVLMEWLYDTVKKHYDKRAKTLKESHPLGIQVDIETGIATGVLVVRNFEDCAKLVRDIVLRNLSFSLKSQKSQSGEYSYVIEETSGSIYRVVTGDSLLTNTFWNFYFNEVGE